MDKKQKLKGFVNGRIKVIDKKETSNENKSEEQ